MRRLCLALAVCILVVGPAHGTVITFENGRTTVSQPGGATVGGFYSGLGVQMPNLRFHHGTFPGLFPFNFSDDWGAVVDFGISSTVTGFVEFPVPVGFVRIDALGQSAFNLGGSEPFSWSIAAFDASNVQVAFSSEMFGFDFSGANNPPDTDPIPLARLSLQVVALGAISRLEINSDRKFGIDTLEFGTAPPVSVAEPWSLALFAVGLAGLGFARRR